MTDIRKAAETRYPKEAIGNLTARDAFIAGAEFMRKEAARAFLYSGKVPGGATFDRHEVAAAIRQIGEGHD